MDAGVGDVDLFQTEFDNSVLKSLDKSQVFVSSKQACVSGQQTLELFHFTLLDKVDNLEVGSQGFLELFIGEDCSLGILAHQKFNNNKKLLNLNPESDGANFWSFPQRVSQTCLSLTVFELDCIDTAYIVQVACKLVVADWLGESNFADKVTSLLVKVLLNVGPNDDIDQGCLANLVKVEARSLVGFKHLGSDLGQQVQFLIGNRREVVWLGNQVVQGASVHAFESLQDEVSKLFGLNGLLKQAYILVVAIVN